MIQNYNKYIVGTVTTLPTLIGPPLFILNFLSYSNFPETCLIKFTSIIGFLEGGLSSFTEIRSKNPSKTDVDSGPWGPCVVAAMNKFTRTAEVLWRKRDGMATL